MRKENWESYNTVFIGYPIWWGDAPRIIQTFLESYDFTDKSVFTFSTSGSSPGSAAFNALEAAYPGINLLGNLHFTSSSLDEASERCTEWVNAIFA